MKNVYITWSQFTNPDDWKSTESINKCVVLSAQEFNSMVNKVKDSMKKDIILPEECWRTLAAKYYTDNRADCFHGIDKIAFNESVSVEF